MDAREEYEIEQAMSCLEDMVKRLLPSSEGGCASAAFNAINILRKRSSLYNAVENICGNLPADYEITLVMENGSAFVEALDNLREERVQLPDAADKTLTEQLDDALLAARSISKSRRDNG